MTNKPRMIKLSRNSAAIAIATVATVAGGSAIAGAAGTASSTDGRGSDAKLQAAVDDERPDNTPDRRDRGAALAKALGVDTSKVEAILVSNRPQRGDGGPGARAPPTARW